MSLPDGSFSPQLWVARVVSGGTYEYERERASQAGSPADRYPAQPRGPVSPSDFEFVTPGNSRPGTAGYQPANGPFSPAGYSSSAYSAQGWSPASQQGGFVPRSPTHVYTPKPRTAAWETPPLPPRGYK